MENLKNMIKDKNTFMFEFRKNKKDFIFWGLAIFITLTIFIFIFNKEIGVLQTLSSIIKTLSFIIILLKVINYQNCSGLSLNSLICYIIAFGCRKFVSSFWAVRLRGLEIDYINSTFNSISEFASLLICIALVYTIYFKYPDTSDINIDNQLPFYYLCIPAFILSIPFKPYVFRNWFADLIWIYSFFLESISLYPQINLFSVKKRQIENFTSHFLALQGLSSIFGIIFWFKSFYKYNDRRSLLLGELSGYFLMLSEIIKLFIMSYYFYLYFKRLESIRNNKKYDI
jgi:hypothetical protein